MCAGDCSELHWQPQAIPHFPNEGKCGSPVCSCSEQHRPNMPAHNLSAKNPAAKGELVSRLQSQVAP